MSEKLDYKRSGVNIDAGNEAVGLIKDSVKATYNSQVLNSLGSFAALYQLPGGFREPVLVSCTDGVGTKLKLAIDLDIYTTVGIDLVAMCVNDLICHGATPLFFLDYIASHELIPMRMAQLIEGMTLGCREAGCALVGGEMAEMNDLYRKGDYDLAGFSVGVVERSKIIDGSRIKAGDYVYGFSSSGFHSNGYSLLRKVLSREADCQREGILKEALLEPTRIYVRDVLALLREHHTITGLAHITGGGLVENVARILPGGTAVNIERVLLRTPELFFKVQRVGGIETEEMFRVFNMGIGFVVTSSSPLPERADFYQIGQVVEGKGKVKII